MTDEITLPYNYYGEVFITPDLARQIVALAADHTPATPPAPAPRADHFVGSTDMVAVRAVGDLLRLHVGTSRTKDDEAATIVDAIKAGKVSGLTTTAEAQEALATERETHVREVARIRADLAACCAELEQVKADLAAANARADSIERAGAEQARRADQNYTDLIAYRAELSEAQSNLQSLRLSYEGLRSAEDTVFKDLAAVTAERDRLAGLLRRWSEFGAHTPADAEDALRDDTDAALAELEKKP